MGARVNYRGIGGRAAVALLAMWATLATAVAANERPAIEEAFEVAQWASLSSAGKALHQLGLREAAGSPELSALVRSRQDLVAQAAGREATLSSGIDANTAVRLRGEIDSLQAEIAAIDARLAADFPRYAELALPTPLTIAAIRESLQDGEALLFFLSAQDATYVWAIDRTRAHWFAAPLWTDFLAGEIARLRADLDPHARTRGAATLVEGMTRPRIASFDRTTAYFLYTQLIEPAEAVLKDKTHVFVVADGPLTGLPLSLLVSERPEGADDDPHVMRETAWLARRFAMTTLPTVASLAAIRATEETKTAAVRKPFLGIGAPVLGKAVAEDAPVPPPGADFFRGVYADVAAVRNLPSLPQTGPELRRLASTLGADEDSLLLADRATEQAVRELDLSTTSVIAFATHGLLSGDLRGLAEPALVLTPPDAVSVEDDGLLTASEIAKLRLSADWVILSACNTAGGDGRPDAEGLSGLARAFLYAGARSILVSHWPVRDDAAAKLTTGTLEVVKTDPAVARSEALRLAMIAVMEDAHDPTLAHPSAWAPFVIVGDGGN